MEVVQRLLATHFPEAELAFLAGSTLRGEATPGSDLDVVVIYPMVAAAWRQSLTFESWPVEVFVHDPETLAWFFFEQNRAEGVPSLAAMVDEGIAVPGPTDLSRELKRLARLCLEHGPPAWSEETLEDRKYALSDLADDLLYCQDPGEFRAISGRLGEQLGDYIFRSRGRWSAKGKTVVRQLKRLDPALGERYSQALQSANPMPLYDLTREIIGEFVFDGYRRQAPVHWRRPTLKTARLTLRPPLPGDDVKGFLTLNSQHLQPTGTGEAPGELSETAVRFLIFLGTEIIGTANLTQIFHGKFEACYLGFALAERHQGQGYMTEALQAVIRYAFEDLGLHRIMANHLLDNQRSARLLARLGFVTEGTAGDYLKINGEWRDHVLTALTRP